jgi:hypothetical protein
MTSPRPAQPSTQPSRRPSRRTGFEIAELLAEHERALAYTDELWAGLTVDEVRWRPTAESSAIGWHLGHQAAVAHYMIRNLTAAEPPIDAELDRLMDGATAEPDRGDLPGLDALQAYRKTSAERLRFRIGNIASGDVGAPQQLGHIAIGLLLAVINHEYQHSKWISEVRSRDLGHALPDLPTSDLLTEIDGYLVVGA